MSKIKQIYQELLKMYGPQGWWPLINHKGHNPTKTGSINGYHPGDYSFPKNRLQIFEICLGAILTQNTAWPNVEKALINLDQLNAISPKQILNLDDEKLKQAIKPAGYFNQKAKKLRAFAEFFINLAGKTPSREELLNIWGVGPETADSMLLYAYQTPSFVVDAYTRRIFANLGFINEKAAYDEVKNLFEDNLKSDVRIFQEYHALIVEHAKRYYSKKDSYSLCSLKIVKTMTFR